VQLLQGNLGVSLSKNGDDRNTIHRSRLRSHFIPERTSPVLCHEGHSAANLTWAATGCRATRTGALSRQEKQPSQPEETVNGTASSAQGERDF